MQIEHIFGLIAAIVLFLYGIEHLSRELQAIASDRLRVLLQKLTKNRWTGALAGAATTAAIQSSTAATVIAVGLVDAGIIPFAHSLGIIAGANVGTTVTAQLVAFKLTALAPIFIILGFLIGMFGGKLKFIGKTIFYFGFLFLAINFISEAVGPLKDDPQIMEMMGRLDNAFLAIAIGALITILLQSSTATTGIAVVMGSEGLLGLGAAIPIIIGANLGTTSTTLIVGWRMGLFAKRTAVAHALFNVCGVLIFLPILVPFAGLVEEIGGTTGQMIANAHTLFNVATAIVFLILLKPAIRAVEWIVPGREAEILFRSEYLEQVPEETGKAILAVEKELKRQMELMNQSFYLSYGMVRSGKATNLAKVNKIETLNSYLENKISNVLVDLSLKPLSKEQSEDIILLARISNKVEQMGNLSRGFAKLAVMLDERGEHILPEAVEELDGIKKGFDGMMKRVMEKGWGMDKRTLLYLSRHRAQTDQLIQKAYQNHIRRMADARISAYTSTIFVDAAYSLEQANSALLRLAKLLLKLKAGRENQ